MCIQTTHVIWVKMILPIKMVIAMRSFEWQPTLIRQNSVVVSYPDAHCRDQKGVWLSNREVILLSLI